jgi:hypothetical protein
MISAGHALADRCAHLVDLVVTGGCRTDATVEDPSTITEDEKVCGTRAFAPSDATSGCDADGHFYDVGCTHGFKSTGEEVGLSTGWCAKADFGKVGWLRYL